MFNLENVEETTSILPAGEYSASVTDAELKDSKKGGQYIKIALTIADGDFKGWKVFHNFNVKNENESAVKIGLGQLKSLLRCAGAVDVNSLNSVTDLLGARVTIRTKIRKDEQWGDKAEVSYFKEAKKSEEPLPY